MSKRLLAIAILASSCWLGRAQAQTDNVDPEIVKQLSQEDSRLPPAGGKAGEPSQPASPPAAGASAAATPPPPTPPGPPPPMSDGKINARRGASPPPSPAPPSPILNPKAPLGSAAAPVPTPAPAAKPAQPTVTATPPHLEAIEGFLQYYEYNPQGKRDPFAAPVDGAPGGALGPVLPLQRYDLEQLRLTGIIWDVSRPKAMVRDPAGQVHIVIPNDKLGRNNGYVAVIREGEVVVVEPIQDEGRIVFSTKLMKLAK